VVVEKLTRRKMVDKTLQSETLQTTIANILCSQIPAILTKQEFFNRHAC